MDPHVRTFAAVVKVLCQERGGELYDSPVLDTSDHVAGVLPAMQFEHDRRKVNVVLFDVPGNHDHFSVIVTAWPKFAVSLRHEARFDWVMKTIGRAEDHQIGVPDFDRHYLIGGRPKDDVIAFLTDPTVERDVDALGDFLSLAADTGFIRVTWPLEPQSHYTLDDLHKKIDALLRLAKACEEQRDIF